MLSLLNKNDEGGNEHSNNCDAGVKVRVDFAFAACGNCV
jgi:hypothetical protein